MTREPQNGILQQFLLDEYFPDRNATAIHQTQAYQSLIENIEDKILNEAAADYKKEIASLLAHNDEEEIFLRGSLFKKEIPKVYNNACCISGLRINSKLNISMIDACHIRPFSQSYDDTITNGISLCPNLHRAFDRGIIAIDNNYTVMVSGTFSENDSIYGIKQFHNKPITLPARQEYWPALINLEWHRNHIFQP